MSSKRRFIPREIVRDLPTLAGDAAPVRESLGLPDFLPFRLTTLSNKVFYDAFRDPEIYRGLSVRGWKVLALLGAYPDISNADISSIIGMDPATVTRAVRELRQRDLVATQPSPDDRRKLRHRLTREGAALHDAIVPGRRARGERYEEALTPAERRTLHRLLDKLDAAVDAILAEERLKDPDRITHPDR